MKYIIKNRKFTALLILLTFIFTSILPTNIVGWNSRAEAAVGTVTYTKATNIENGKDYVIVYNNQHVLKRNNNGYTVASDVTIKDGKLTVSNQEQNDILWTITTGNNGKIVNKGNSDVKLSVRNNNTLATNESKNLLVIDSNTIGTNSWNNNRYLSYSGNQWTASSSSNNKISFYVKEAEEDLSDTNFQSFNVYYIATGQFPNTYAGAGNASDYGPSGNNVPLVAISVDLNKLRREYVDVPNPVVKYEVGANGNQWHYIPNGPNKSLDASKAFWAAVWDCMSEESQKTFRATGFTEDDFCCYVLTRYSII